jgi:hypothetical protein|tara:strand:+ start:1528 stop:1932 length:405 start_codon:yes stop_codon:yes gene_type:complete
MKKILILLVIVFGVNFSSSQSKFKVTDNSWVGIERLDNDSISLWYRNYKRQDIIDVEPIEFEIGEVEVLFNSALDILSKPKTDNSKDLELITKHFRIIRYGESQSRIYFIDNNGKCIVSNKEHIMKILQDLKQR